MARAFLEIVALISLLLIAGWGLIRLYYIWKNETAEDRRLARETKLEADDALEELERAVSRAKSRRRGGQPKEGS